MSNEQKRRGRPRKPEVAFDAEACKEFLTRLFTIEKEIKVLREDKIQLKVEFADKVDAATIAKIVNLVKIKIHLSDKKNVSEDTVEEIEVLIRDNIGSLAE